MQKVQPELEIELIQGGEENKAILMLPERDTTSLSVCHQTRGVSQGLTVQVPGKQDLSCLQVVELPLPIKRHFGRYIVHFSNKIGKFGYF